jgi:aminoglycoside 6'-N-acetyltransferase I
LADTEQEALRSHAEGCTSTPVAYLEGWFVEAEHRGRGVGAMLLGLLG